MAYIGNTQLNQNYVPAVDFFSGNGSTTAFTLSRPVASVAAIQAVISNVPQDPGSAFTVSGSTITFTSAPPSGTNNIYVYYTSPNTSVATLSQGPVITGNLNMGSTGARITGDFSNATIANRVAFQTSTANSISNVGVIPNGLGTEGGVDIFNSSDPSNASRFRFIVNTTEATLRSISTGTGTNLPMTFHTGGSERMRIDTSGNVGIGTSSPVNKVEVSGAITLRQTYQPYLVNSYYDGAWKYVENGMAWGIGNNFGGPTNGMCIATAAVNSSGSGAALTWSPRLNIDPSGNVGIGTSSPGAALDITRSTSPSIRLTDTSGAGSRGGNISGSWGGNGIYLDSLGAAGWVYVGSSPGGGQATTIRFDTSNAERMRIDSSGNLLVGTTTAPLYGILQVYKSGGNNASFVCDSGYNAIFAWNKGTGSQPLIEFGSGASYTIRGSITTNGTTVAYNTSSDYRLKENIQPMQNALGVVQQLKPVTYTWKADGSDGQGFIAHELQAVVPDCVTGEKDAVDAEGNPVYQGIDTSFLVATLTAAIQELNAKVDAQAAEIAALKGAK